MSELTQERLKEVLDYDPETGNLFWKVPISPRVRVGEKAGTPNSSNAMIISVDKRRYQCHRVIWLWMTGAWPEHEVDHKDTNPLNNRWENLRACTRAQNMHNTKVAKNNKLGVKGVRYRKGKYQVRVHNKAYGSYDDLELAEFISQEARATLHGEFARG